MARQGPAGRGGRLVAAIGGVAVTRLWAGGRAGRADVGYYASWRAISREGRKRTVRTGTVTTKQSLLCELALKTSHVFYEENRQYQR